MKKTALYGAILGDIIGVPYEFDKNKPDTKDFPLFRKECNFSDDTVTTVAIAEDFYGIPEILIEECRKRLPKDMLEVIDKFNEEIFPIKKFEYT